MYNVVNEEIEIYAKNVTQKEPELLEKLILETNATQDLPHMLTGRLEGRFLKMLVGISGALEVLELGTFTGYSALSMAEALPENGRLITCEISEKPAAIAKKYFAQSQHSHKIEIKMQKGMEVIESIQHKLDFVFIDADKAGYLNYFYALLPKLKVGGLMAFDNTLWSGRVLDPQKKSDKAIHELNEAVLAHDKVENVMLTVRDGINLVRKTKN